MNVTIKKGDLYDMTEFDFSRLGCMLNTCSDVLISREGIVFGIGLKNITLCGDVIEFGFLKKRLSFDEIIINCVLHNGVKFVNFTIKRGDTETYLSVVSDV